MIRWSFVFLNILFTQINVHGQSPEKLHKAIDNINHQFKQIALHKDSSAQDSSLQISLLTLTPGEDLYSVFGHSAIRVKDSKIGTDIVYNYGTFDFSDPNFLPKFIRGELDYFVSQETYDEFLNFYSSDKRGLDEQFLHLTTQQKRNIQQFLFWNMEPGNRFYRYNFLYNNCTTKLRDIIKSNSDEHPQTEELPTTKGKSFRDGLHFYLDRADHQWVKLGIDIILGSRIDKTMNNFESQFLPDFLEEGLDLTKINGQQFVYLKKHVLEETLDSSKENIFTPLNIFALFFILYLLLLVFRNKFNHSIIQTTEIILHTITGIIGCIILFLWIYTLHEQSKDNYNIFWAWPLQILAPFFYKKKSKIVANYWLIYSIMMFSLLLFWKLIPQQINTSLIPLIIVLGISGLRNYKLSVLNMNKQY